MRVRRIALSVAALLALATLIHHCLVGGPPLTHFWVLDRGSGAHIGGEIYLHHGHEHIDDWRVTHAGGWRVRCDRSPSPLDHLLARCGGTLSKVWITAVRVRRDGGWSEYVADSGICESTGTESALVGEWEISDSSGARRHLFLRADGTGTMLIGSDAETVREEVHWTGGSEFVYIGDSPFTGSTEFDYGYVVVDERELIGSGTERGVKVR